MHVLKCVACGIGLVMLIAAVGCETGPREEPPGTTIPGADPDAGPVTTPDDGTAPTNLELMAQSEQAVGADYPNALLIEVIGIPSTGTATTADDIDTYQFRHVEDITSAGSGTVIVDYANAEFADPYLNPDGLVGTIFDPLPRDRSLTDAIALLRAAGYEDAFSAYTLRKPLTFPEPPETYYIFSLPNRFVFVGAETGEVSEEPFALQTGQNGRDSLQLLSDAEQLAWADYPNALLIEVIGFASGGNATTADEIDRYEFRFVEDPNDPTAFSVLVYYDRGQFIGPEYLEDILIGTVFDPLPRDHNLADAVQFLRDAGHDSPFPSVVLRKPLIFPMPEEASYIFTLQGQYVLVGAETGQVQTEP